MRRLFFILAFLLSCGSIGAQQLIVKSFEADPFDNAAIKFEKKDGNNESCPLVIVQIALADVTFDGYVVEVEQKDGEYWVYMSNGAKWLEVKAKGYISPEFDIADKFPQGLAGKTTYKLIIDKPVTGNEPKGTIVVSSNVADADFYVDGVKQLSGAPPYKYSGGEGMHKITLKAKGYNDESAEFEIKLGQTLKYQVQMKAEGSFQLDGVSYEMVNINAAPSFLLGSASSIDKTYKHVGLRSYKIGKTEVTQALWKAVMNSNPSIHQGDNLPVENVSWEDCQEFIRLLNEKCGTHFRLPTEVEWEYAARSGGVNAAEDFAGSKTLSDVANVSGQTIDVASKKPNGFGLYDMTGNVAEWCEDWWESYASKGKSQGNKTSFFKIVRGGSYADGANRDKLRCYYRGKQKPENAQQTIGLRLAQDN